MNGILPIFKTMNRVPHKIKIKNIIKNDIFYINVNKILEDDEEYIVKIPFLGKRWTDGNFNTFDRHTEKHKFLICEELDTETLKPSGKENYIKMDKNNEYKIKYNLPSFIGKNEKIYVDHVWTWREKNE